MQQEHNNGDVRREDLNQKHEGGSRDTTRTGSTGGDIHAGEWTLGDEEAQRTENPNTGSYTGRSTNAGNGGDMPDKNGTT